MSNNDTTHSIRVPFKSCDKLLIRYRQKSFAFGMEWPQKGGDNPNLIISIFDNDRMGSPPSDMTVHEIDDHGNSEQVGSFLSQTSFNETLIPSNHQDDVTSTTTASQMMSPHMQIPSNGNLMSMPNSFPTQNPPAYSSAQSTMMAQTNTNIDQTYFSPYSVTQTPNSGQITPIDSPLSMTNQPVGQPLVCACPQPNLRHEINCSAFRHNPQQMIQHNLTDPRMFNPAMNYSSGQKLLPSIQILTNHVKHGGPGLSSNTTFMPAPLLRPSRPNCFGQPVMMPRATSDINSMYYTHALQQPTMPTANVNPMLCPTGPKKRLTADDTTTNQKKTPRKRVNKPKSVRLPSPSAIDSDRSPPESESRGQPTQTLSSKPPATTTVRHSIRIVPEETSPQETPSNESNKRSPVSNSHSTSSPMETSVRSPVSIDPSICPEETSVDHVESQLSGIEKVIEQVVQSSRNENSTQILLEPRSNELDCSPTKKRERKRTTCEKRKIGRPAKIQPILFPSTNYSSDTRNIFEAIPYANSAPDHSHLHQPFHPNICNNNLERITPLSTEFTQIEQIFNEYQHQTMPGLHSGTESSNTLDFDQHCFDHFNDAFPMLTPGSVGISFAGVDPSATNSASQENIFTDYLSHDLTSNSSNIALWQEDQVSSSVLTPPGS